MKQIRAWFIRLAGLWPAARRERELADEIESHLQMHIADNLRCRHAPRTGAPRCDSEVGRRGACQGSLPRPPHHTGSSKTCCAIRATRSASCARNPDSPHRRAGAGPWPVRQRGHLRLCGCHLDQAAAVPRSRPAGGPFRDRPVLPALPSVVSGLPRLETAQQSLHRRGRIRGHRLYAAHELWRGDGERRAGDRRDSSGLWAWRRCWAAIFARARILRQRRAPSC